MSMVQNGRGLGSREPNLNFWDPLITFERIKLSVKLHKSPEDGPLLRIDHKTTTHTWAWPRSRDQNL